MQKFEYTATCLFGLEKFVGDEIEELGYEKTETIDGRVTFTGGYDAIARANINLRCAERVLINVGRFEATSFDELFEGTKALPWEEWICENDAFPVRGHSVKSKLFSIPDCQKIIKKAAATRLENSYGVHMDEDGETLQIEFFILNDRVTMMIDTSGAPLHKRGYRPEAGIAPLRETLAAAMVKISRPRENVITWDPFCGSGTIPIEAAMLMTGRAPGMRRTFSAENFDSIPMDIWSKAREEATDRIKDNEFCAYASDIDPACVEIAKENIRRAGVENNVKCFVADALKIKSGGLRGTIVCNPPYGERLSTKEGCEELYKKMGVHFKTLAPWQVYVITSHENFGRLYGRRPDKIRRLYNGMIKCNYYQFFKNN